ncbi:HAD-IA family hydrolase [Psittacicella hinzii]|uniref:phosphoglycolate phosphatase n=1 Tax=Psittacicella hinzii TaxID=2028575 RepID=A0A3A1YSI1_9GAMM|nr:HAD-IA family hydrolase [Psittacicella hinzii]RIY40456.1 hypothetical protein CKF58_00550 [Psittacicella hinzii]
MSKTMYDLMVFDLDGTLLATIEDIAHTYRLACKDFGFPLPPTKEVTNWIGKGHEAAITECYAWLRRELLQDKANFPCLADKPELAQADVDTIHEQLLKTRPEFTKVHTGYYDLYGNTNISLFPGVRKSLERLKAQGVKLAVLTNKPKFLTPAALERVGIYELFDAVYADGDLQNNKPHPEGILRHMENFGVIDKQRVLMVGDSENDIKAGLAAQVQVLGLTYGYNYGKDIALSNPTYVSDHFAAVVALNEDLPLVGQEFTDLVIALEA